MSKDYHHLTYAKRCQIDALKKRGDSKSSIAKQLNVDRSTIYREIARNSGARGYCYEQAHKKAQKKRKDASRSPSKMNEKMTSLINEKLSLQWSPVQISGWMKRQKKQESVSHETIYRYIWKDKNMGGLLYKELRRKGKKYNKRGKNHAGRGCIPNRVDIDERSSIVDEKKRLGDWELDTIIGAKHKGAIVSMVDRASKFTKLFLVPRKTANDVSEAITKCLVSLKDYVLTLTADN